MNRRHWRLSLGGRPMPPFTSLRNGLSEIIESTTTFIGKAKDSIKRGEHRKLSLLANSLRQSVFMFSFFTVRSKEPAFRELYPF
jgi:hypothetical protein